MTTPSQLGRRIRRLRVEQGLSQKDVAEPVVTAAYLSLIESGQRMPSDEILEHLAERLDVTAAELLSGIPAGLEAQLEVDLQEGRRHLREGDVVTAEDKARTILREAAKRQFPRIQARALTLLGLIAEDKGDIEAATATFEEALEAWASEPLHLRYEAVAGLGRCQYFAGHSRQGAHELESYLLELTRVGIKDPTAEARIHSTLIHLYRSLGLKDKELEAAQAADSLAVDVKEADQVACLKINVAAALIEHGEYGDAVDAAREAERIYGALGWPVSIARSQVEQALAERGRNNLKAARRLLRDALEVLDRLPGDAVGRGYVLNELAVTERLLGDTQAALDNLQQALPLIPEKDVAEQARNARETGLCFLDSNPKKAERELRRALELYQEADSRNEVSATLLHIGRLQQSQGKTKQALKTLEEAVEATVGEVR